MARLSKSHHFKIFEDTGIPTPPGDENDPFDEAVQPARISNTSSNHDSASKHDRRNSTNSPPSDADDDDEEAIPRDSLTSVSSFPESQHNDAGHTPAPVSPQKFFTPQIIRPSFRRPESVRRMQMSSPRQSELSYYRSSRSGTPRSDYGRGSPRGRGRRITEELTSESEGEAKQEEGKEHPLVLLHGTLLPVALPWSMESMQELLPPQVLENLMLLRSKISETVLQRGILIPHPGDEYEMLEERLLEALELKEPRLTKCGHFRGRVSDTSQASSGRDSDSGLGSSDSSSDDGDLCMTCGHHVRCKAGKKSQWSVKVFAANGLMRASAWQAAWSEMESVDLEILPWVGEEERRKLDLRKEEEARLQRQTEKEENMRGEMTNRKMVVIPQQRRTADDASVVEALDGREHAPVAPIDDIKHHQTMALPNAATAGDLPPVYRPSQIPLSVLLRNYIYLLAQDRRNVAMFFLGILVVFFAVRSVPAGSNSALVAMDYQSLDELAVMGGSEAAVQEETQTGDMANALESVTKKVSDMLGDEDEAFFEVEEQESLVSLQHVPLDGQDQQDVFDSDRDHNPA